MIFHGGCYFSNRLKEFRSLRLYFNRLLAVFCRKNLKDDVNRSSLSLKLISNGNLKSKLELEVLVLLSFFSIRLKMTSNRDFRPEILFSLIARGVP